MQKIFKDGSDSPHNLIQSENAPGMPASLNLVLVLFKVGLPEVVTKLGLLVVMGTIGPQCTRGQMEALNCLKPQCHIYHSDDRLTGAAMRLHLQRVLEMVNVNTVILLGQNTWSEQRCCLISATRKKHEFKSKMFKATSLLISHSTSLAWASIQLQKLLIEKVVSSQEKWPHNTAAVTSYDDYSSLALK